MVRLYQTTKDNRLYGKGTEIPQLKTIAREAGLEKRAEDITKIGEEPKRIFSGGVVSDIFDTLNAIQYGVVGVMKGKGFSEGVKTRQSWSDKDALGDFGVPGLIGGIALDIASDPLTYIAPWTILRKVPGLVKGAKALKTVTFESRLGQSLGRAFVYRFGQSKVYKELAERSIKSIAIGNQNLLDLARPITKLSPEAQKAISKARKAGELHKLPSEILEKAKPAFDELDKLGKQAVEVGLLPRSVYQKNVGRYIARLYEPKELPKGIKQLFPRKPIRIDLSRFMKRKDIPDEVRTAMGEIMEAGYPTAKSLVQLNKAVEQSRFFTKVAQTFSKGLAKDGFSQLPITKRLGELSGRYVPKPIFDDIQEIMRVREPAERALNKVVGAWKFGKVILNPATHGRNILSNFLLNNFEGLAPYRLDIYGEAATQLVKKGKWYKEAKKIGLGLDTFASKEIKDILTSQEGILGLKKYGKQVNKTIDSIANIYQKEEEWAKLAQYIFQRKKGLTSEGAWEIAQRATFNYSQVTPFVRRLRESVWGYPFITFTYKVTPQVAKTFLRRPTAISNIGKIKTAIENQADIKELTRERASEPEWIRDGFYVKLPMKDKYNRSAYFDLSYIVPFGDLISGQVLKQPPAFFGLIKEIATNKDFYGNKIWKQSDTQELKTADLMRHLMKFGLPPLISDQIPGGYRKDGTRRKGTLQRAMEKEMGVEGAGAQQRTLMQEMLRGVGLKIQPIDIDLQEYWAEKSKEEELQVLMQEAGILQKFEKYYVPQEKKKGRLY